MTEMVTTTLRRLNGRPQACDPCRARKVACDHTHPVCNRCRKRRQATTCTYTIADTSRRVPRTSPSSPLSPAAAGTRGATTTAAKRRSREMSNHNGASSPSTGSSSTVLTPGPSSAAALAGPGYLGFTSFTAVFEEARDSLNLLQGGRRGLLEECDVSTGLPGAAFIGNGITAATLNGNNNRNGGSGGVSPKDDAISLILNGPTREMCLVVLRNIPDLSDKEIFIAMQTSVHAGAVWTSHAARTILHELKDNPLLRDRTEPNLEALAQTLCRNTARPMDDGVEGWEQWSAQFTGDNLRWESLGLLFTYKELFTDDEDKKVFWSSGGGRNQRMQKSWRMTALACMRLCLDLAKSFCDGNLLLLHLCFRRSVMESMAVGDASLTCWRSHAEAVSLLSFLGLHAEPDPPNYVPSFSSEMKRRMFAYVFNIDKVSASFQGRPPLLGHRYASTPLPLDITDEVLMRGRDAIIEAASKLDERGWSDDPIMSAAKLIRGRTMLARIKDELLEIALGNSKHVSVDTLLDIKARATDVVAHFPRALIYKADEDHDDPNLDVTTIYSRMLTRIEYLQNHFFAERLLLRRGHVNDGELLHISFEMVSLTLTFWVHKDRFADVRPDFEWLVMEYAAPGGGILCMELLRPTISHAHPRDPGITRSTIIQRLSLLVGFLDWVSPDAPNADLCMNCKTVIRRVLDHALNGPASSGSSGDGAASSSSPGGGGGGGGGSGNAVMVGAFDIDVMGSYFNFDLLDTFDWLRSDENNQMGEL